MAGGDRRLRHGIRRSRSLNTHEEKTPLWVSLLTWWTRRAREIQVWSESQSHIRQRDCSRSFEGFRLRALRLVLECMARDHPNMHWASSLCASARSCRQRCEPHPIIYDGDRTRPSLRTWRRCAQQSIIDSFAETGVRDRHNRDGRCAASVQPAQHLKQVHGCFNDIARGR